MKLKVVGVLLGVLATAALVLRASSMASASPFHAIVGLT